MLIAFTNTKGGVGKSTLAAHLVLHLFDGGYRVALLDTDQQQTAANWIRAAEPGIPVRVATDVDGIRQARGELAELADLVVADSPGSSSEASQAITLLADMAIVPLQPSKPDLRAIRESLKFVRLAQEMSGGKRPETRIVLTFTAKGDVQTRRLREQLSTLGVPVAAAEVRRLNAFRDACDGAVTRLPSREGRAAAGDIDALFGELLAGKLDGLIRRETAPPQEVANG